MFKFLRISDFWDFSQSLDFANFQFKKNSAVIRFDRSRYSPTELLNVTFNGAYSVVKTPLTIVITSVGLGHVITPSYVIGYTYYGNHYVTHSTPKRANLVNSHGHLLKLWFIVPDVMLSQRGRYHANVESALV